MNKKVSWFPICRYVVPADLEEWLEEKALEGWSIDKLGQFNFFYFKFIKSNSKKYRYVMDLNTFSNENYIEMYKQFGWELVGQMSSCFIWRQEYTDKRPESFSDMDSLMNRNKRIRTTILIVLISFIVGIIASMVGVVISCLNGDVEHVIELSATILFLSLLSYYLNFAQKKIKINMER